MRFTSSESEERKAFGNALSTDWIPAFAGMTAWSVGGGEGQGLADVFGFELRVLALELAAIRVSGHGFHNAPHGHP